MGRPPSNPPPAEPEKDFTSHILKMVNGGKAEHETHAAPQHEEEEKIEVDERWLMTYADKMTILCGLFIMLFAMSKMDEGKLQKIKESAEKSFGKPNSTVVKEFIDPTQFHEVQRELVKTQNQLIQSQREQQELKTRLEKIKPVVPPPPSAPPKVKKDWEAQYKKVAQEKVELERKIEKTQEQVNKLKQQVDSVTKNSDQIDVLKKELLTSENKVKELEKELSAKAGSSFVAFVMSWDTELHDVDLRIEDPSGKVFDFKHRQYKNSPGRFVIDTRRGPGTEVWQSDQTMPGTYKFTYEFYNSYGNTAPCPVTGTLFTQKASIDLPKVELSATKKKQTFVVTIDADGLAKVQP